MMENQEIVVADVVPAPQEFGVLAIGNAGVGKSLLTNILIGENAFAHEAQARAVTVRTEFRDIDSDLEEWGIVRIFNIPGLIEVDATQLDKNKRELQKAFDSCHQQVLLQ